MPDDYDSPTFLKLDAINDMRLGFFGVALQSVRESAPSEEECQRADACGARVKKLYHKGTDSFTRAPWSVYLKAADELEKAGL